MKKYSALILFLIMYASCFACDICGCGVGSNYIGILPEFSKKILGLRYRYNTLLTHIGVGGQTSYLTTTETYRTTELWGGWTIGKRFRAMINLPMNFNEKRNAESTSYKNGLGDIALQSFYKVVDNRKTLGEKLLVHSLWIGAGIKLPTGKYEAPEKNGDLINTANIFQLGTGSVDFTFGMMYDIRLQDVGLNTTINYKMNTKNKEDYQYGNKFSTSTQAYYKIRIANLFTIAPNAGIVYENASLDEDHKYKADVSGGYVLMSTLGIEATFKHIAVGTNFQHPLSQDLANSFVKTNDRLMIHAAFMF